MIEIITIFAILLSPLLAIQAEKWIESFKARKKRQLDVFKKLMTTRGTPLDPEHVVALNMIDLEFNSKKEGEKKVLKAWKALLEHFQTNTDPNDQHYNEKLRSWNTKKDDLLTSLLTSMAKCLDYDFDIVDLKHRNYVPQDFYMTEEEIRLLRRYFLEILSGKRKFPVEIINSEDSPAKD